MALITKKIKGTEDVLPKQSYRWQFIENIMREESRAYGFREIRTPVFEHTELFARGVGQTTDVVQKEMYTFDTKGGESVTLRPEGTAGAARAVLEHALENEGLPIKASYFVSCYRYEKPQAGRLREFHQFGIPFRQPLCWVEATTSKNIIIFNNHTVFCIMSCQRIKYVFCSRVIINCINQWRIIFLKYRAYYIRQLPLVFLFYMSYFYHNYFIPQEYVSTPQGYAHRTCSMRQQTDRCSAVRDQVWQ